MNAEEAFQMSSQSIETIHKDLIASVLNAIEEACKRAEFSIAWPLDQMEEEAIGPVWSLLESKKFRVHREHKIESARWVDERRGPFGLFKGKTQKYTFSYYLRISWYKPDSSV